MTSRAEDRRLDARQKIELGGLVVKAGLREEDKALILGMLIIGRELSADPDQRALLRQRGLRAFKD
jgi:hypothetical protein